MGECARAPGGGRPLCLSFRLSWNYCDADAGCDAWPKGACHLKQFSGNAPAWGCSGAGQGWRSGLASPSLRYATAPPPCGAPSGAAPGVPTSVAANWGGALVLLDADSWKMGEGGNHGSPYVKSAYDCATQCNARKGGNGAEGIVADAFSYCASASRCGSGCEARLRGEAPRDGSKDALFFGPFLDATKRGCTPGGAYKHQTCSCKVCVGRCGARGVGGAGRVSLTHPPRPPSLSAQATRPWWTGRPTGSRGARWRARDRVDEGVRRVWGGRDGARAACRRAQGATRVVVNGNT